jgi:serine/threonine protein kinase
MSRRQGRSNRRRSVVTADGMPIIDGFRVDEQIGEGGFSQVYRGSQETPARPAAIKVFRTSGDVGARVRERFQRECSVIGELSSLDGLVTVFTGGFTLAGAPYLAMELCDGGSMSSHVANHGPLDVDEVVTVGTRIGSALASVHARGVTHRDVKPSNILMASGGRALLTDFGLASMGQISEAFGEESRVAMTEVYAPPERLDPDNTPGQATDAAGDQYSFALTLYAMLLGASPIPGETTGARILKAAKGERKPLNRSDVSTEVLGVLLRAMAPIPADRWPSMAGMVEALGSASGRAGPQSSHGSASRPSPPAQMPVGLRPPPKPSSPWYQTEAELTSEPKKRLVRLSSTGTTPVFDPADFFGTGS